MLYTGKDFVIINFDGEPELSLSARRIKRSPLEDVAGMVRSIHYATSEALLHLAKIGVVATDAVSAWRQAADFWHQWSSSAFLRAYLATTEESRLLPGAPELVDQLLQFHLLERAMGELSYQLAGHSDRAAIPLRAILDLSNA